MSLCFLEDEAKSIDQQHVSQYLADGDAEDGDGYVGSSQAQHNGDGTAQEGEEGEESHPGSSACHESLCLVQTLLLDVQVFLYPFHFSQSAHAIIEHGTEHIAYAAIDDKGEGLKSGSL